MPGKKKSEEPVGPDIQILLDELEKARPYLADNIIASREKFIESKIQERIAQAEAAHAQVAQEDAKATRQAQIITNEAQSAQQLQQAKTPTPQPAVAAGTPAAAAAKKNPIIKFFDLIDRVDNYDFFSSSTSTPSPQARNASPHQAVNPPRTPNLSTQAPTTQARPPAPNSQANRTPTSPPIATREPTSPPPPTKEQLNKAANAVVKMPKGHKLAVAMLNRSLAKDLGGVMFVGAMTGAIASPPIMGLAIAGAFLAQIPKMAIKKALENSTVREGVKGYLDNNPNTKAFVQGVINDKKLGKFSENLNSKGYLQDLGLKSSPNATPNKPKTETKQEPARTTTASNSQANAARPAAAASSADRTPVFAQLPNTSSTTSALSNLNPVTPSTSPPKKSSTASVHANPDNPSGKSKSI